jgi:hypothetical protein
VLKVCKIIDPSNSARSRFQVRHVVGEIGMMPDRVRTAIRKRPQFLTARELICLARLTGIMFINVSTLIDKLVDWGHTLFFFWRHCRHFLAPLAPWILFPARRLLEDIVHGNGGEGKWGSG